MSQFTIIRTHRRGKPLTRAELLHSRWEGDNPSRAVAEYLRAYPIYKKDTLVAEPVTTRKGAA